MTQDHFSIARIAEALAAAPPPLPPQYFFFNPEVIKPSSVVVPIVDVDGQAGLILTKRASRMRNHAGDWVFPGGRIDPDVDADARAGALRELREELGVDEAQVRIIGALDARGPLMTGHVIDVFVGVIVAGAVLRPDPTEVAQVAIVPLRELADPRRHFTSTRLPGAAPGEDIPRVHRPEPLEMHFFDFGEDELVWGTQGEIIWDLLSCVLRDRPTIAQIRA